MIDLRQGDCMELIRSLPDNSVDLVLNDPPYGVTTNPWDTSLDMTRLWPELWRVCKPDAAVLLFAQLPFAADLVLSDRANYRYDWVVDKPCPTGFLNAKKRPLRAHEQILVFYRLPGIYNPQFWQSNPYARKNRKPLKKSNYNASNAVASTESDGRRYPRDVLPQTLWRRDGCLHPTQKPTPLLEFMIKTYTNPGAVVLDHTMGVGSTGVACINTGRSFIGFEQDVGYFEAAQRRVAEAQERKALEDAQMQIGGVT